MAASNETVLITGGSGFVGSHCVLLALQKGYSVRTTVRDIKRSEEVKQMLRTGGAREEQANSVQFFAADLTKDDGWEEAVRGCTYVLHVASPFPPEAPKQEDELIVPAREGTLRALRFAKKAGTIKRVVVTSSFAAVSYGHGSRGAEKPFTEDDWTILDGSDKIPAYQKSKTLAEKAAWDWLKKEGAEMELATVIPVVVLGPVLSKDFATSVTAVSRQLNGEIPALPDVAFGVVDVRDIADLHFRAMTDAKAAGQRYLGCADGDFMSMKQMGKVLKEGLPAQDSKRVTTRQVPNFLIRLVALVDPTIGVLVPELSKRLGGSNAKAKKELGWSPRSQEAAILASAKSLKECGAVKA